jgi:hypothetical protein
VTATALSRDIIFDPQGLVTAQTDITDHDNREGASS